MPTPYDIALRGKIPGSDDTYVLGTDANRWKAIRGVIVKTNHLYDATGALLIKAGTNIDSVTEDVDGGITINAATQGGGGGGLELIERKVITADADDYTFSGLDGETDGVYRLIWRIKNNGIAFANVSIEPNNLSTLQQTETLRISAGAVSGAVPPSAFLLIGESLAVGGQGSGVADFWARRVSNGIAQPRFINAQAYMGVPGAGGGRSFYGVWNDLVTDVTSIVVQSSQVNGIGSGSELALYKYAQ